MQNDVIPPWYKQFWPWFIIGILIFAVVIGVGLLIISILNQDSMVKDNYYKEGRAINMHLGRDNRASELELSARFNIDSVTGEVSLQLDGKLDQQPQVLQLEILSPSHAERDRTVILRWLSGNTYVGQLEDRMQGRHYVDLSDPASPGEQGWRLTDEVVLSPEQAYQLTAR